jgi:restriction system protein
MKHSEGAGLDFFLGFLGSVMVAIIAKCVGFIGLFPVLSAIVFWGALVFGGLSLFLTGVAVMEWVRPRTKINGFEQKFLDLIKNDIPVLARKKFQISGKNDYGIVEQSRWYDEWERYSRDILPEKCQRAGLTYDSIHKEILQELPDRSKKILGRTVHQMIEAAVAELKNASRDLDGITPLGFEVLCMEKLTSAGWDARATKTTGDQGADIVATFSDETLVVQCKLYSRPVGNKAVQEIAAARVHYGADYAAVVTNSSFTRAAQDLAASTGVKLVIFVDMATALAPENVHTVS